MANKFHQLLKEKIVLLDGSTGTMLQQYGMPTGISPEAFCLEQPEIIKRIQQEYITAGSDIILTPTFGANRIKLKNYGLEKETVAINQRLAELSLAIAGKQNRLVAGDVGPTGIFFQPFGETPFADGIEIYSEQIRALERAGVDLIVIETQIDIQETRIALLAAKETTTLPVIVSMTFDEGQRTLTGSDPCSCLNIVQSLGADGFGINCSTGPDKMIDIVKQIREIARIPIFVKPNAGLPVVKNGETAFPMNPEEFASYVGQFWEQGVAMLGGCCGTTPQHIARVYQAIKGKKTKPPEKRADYLLLSSARKSVSVHHQTGRPIRVIGERINPTGKPALQEELKAGKLDLLKSFAREQKEKGADLLDVNIGMAGIDEKEIMLRAIAELAVITDLPLCIDSSRSDVIEAALRFYPGRVLVNSISGEKEKLECLIPVIKKYGPAYIVLPLDDRGIPETLDNRIAVLEEIFTVCNHAGIAQQDSVVDGLVMTVSSNQAHANIVLETLRYVSQHLRLNTVLGFSNISFGLPGREFINSAFLAMAAREGPSLVIANPSAPLLMNIEYSVDVLTGRDTNSQQLIEQFQKQAAMLSSCPTAVAKKNAQLSESLIHDCIVKGEKENIEDLLQSELEKGTGAFEIVQKFMIPAIQLVGKKFNQREYFLPHLIAAAETMEKGVQFLTPHISQEEQEMKGVGVIATVIGDIHDIGKNCGSAAAQPRIPGYRLG